MSFAMPRGPSIVWTVLMLWPALSRAAEPPRDWKSHPAIVEIDTKQDLYALGDVHGDYERLLSVLTAAKLIDGDPGAVHKVKWTGGKAVLVCTGDLIDKWDHSLMVIALFRALQTSAAAQGGQVVVTMGNHEAEFLADPSGKKSTEFVAELKASGLDPRQVAAGTDADGVGAFLRGLPFAARVNDWFFIHAGNTKGRTLKKLQADLQDGVDAHGFQAAVLLEDDGVLEARLNPLPWWEKPDEKAAVSQERLRTSVQVLGVHHLVIGHQPGKVTFNDGTTRKAGVLMQKFEGLIFFIDVGMSRGVAHSNGAILKVDAGKKLHVTVLPATGEVRTLWP